MTGCDLQLHLRYRNSIWKKEPDNNFVHAQNKNVITLPVSFTRSYAEDEPNFPRQSNLILQKKVSGVDKVMNFKYFLRPNKEIN